MCDSSSKYKIVEKENVFLHSLFAWEENTWYDFVMPFSENVDSFNPKFCIICDDIRRKSKSALICKSCKKQNKTLSSNIRKMKTICSTGMTNNAKSVTSKEKTRKTNLEKYGVEYYSQTDEAKTSKRNSSLKKFGTKSPLQTKEVQEKTKQTNLEKYGVEHYSQTIEFKDKFKKTNLEKYGVENPSQSDIVKDKFKKTNLKKYGVENPSQSDIVKNKKKQTNNENWNTNNYTQSLEFQMQKYGMSFDDFKEQWLKDYYANGISYVKNKYDLSNSHILRKFIPQKDKKTIGSIAEKTINELIDLDFEKNVRSIVPSNNHMEIDLLNREHKISIEFNGVYWHQIHTNKLEKDLSKAEEMRDLGYKHFALDETDMDKLELLNKMISPNKTKLYARKLSLNAINNPKEFLDNNHLQGSVRAKIAYGLFLNDELIQTMTFGHSRFDKSIDWEILRLCTKPEYLVVGGAERLFKAFQKEHMPSTVVSYSDNKYFDGNVYGKLGMEFVENTQSNYVWWKNGISLKRYQTMKHKLIDILGDRFDPTLTEKENMENNGWIQIKDLGNKKWIFNQ